jgi:probable HAF family extracellular repeat protein
MFTGFAIGIILLNGLCSHLAFVSEVLPEEIIVSSEQRTVGYFARVFMGGLALAATGCGSDGPIGPDPRSYSVSAPVRIYELGPAQELGIPEGFGLDINDAGTVIGGKPTDGVGLSGFMWTAAGGVKDLGSPGGGTYTWALAINGSGQVAGGAIARGDSMPAAYLRSASGTFRPVGMGKFSFANAVNDAGVVGGQTGVDGRVRAFRWTEASGPVLLRDRGGSFNAVRAVNIHGDAVGMFNTPEDWAQRAAFWNAAGELRELPRLPGGPYASAQAINDAGLVGGAADTPSGGSHAVLWYPDGRMQDIGTLGGRSSIVLGMNELGEVVGFSDKTTDGELGGFFWTAESGMLELPGLPGAKYTQAQRINENGQVVGYSGGSVVLWQITRPTR